MSLDSKATTYFAANPVTTSGDTSVNWHYWAGGIAITGSGANQQIRPVTFSCLGDDGVVTFIPLRPFRTGSGWLEEGDTVTLYPGCSGDFSECDEKFGNAAAFGGLPFVPAYITEASTTSGSSGGK
jgi:hypothetical protein